MKLTIERELLLKSLQQLAGVATTKTIPILGNVLMQLESHALHLTCSDMEVEIQSKIPFTQETTPGAVTVSIQKLLDICKGLDATAHVTLELLDDQRLKVSSGRSKYNLATLPVQDFPNIESWSMESEFSLKQSELAYLIQMTKTSMPTNDVRFYLNGMLFEAKSGELRTVSTDGHRMSTAVLAVNHLMADKRVIIPRKTILELVRLLTSPNEMVTLQLNANNLRILIDNYVFTSKLIEGAYPDYAMVIPRNPDKCIELDRDGFKQICSRVAILSSDLSRGVLLHVESGQIRLTNAINSEHEEGEEFLDVNYQGDPLDIGFNVHYLIDILNTVKGERIRISVRDSNASVLLEDCTDPNVLFVVMPVRF